MRATRSKLQKDLSRKMNANELEFPPDPHFLHLIEESPSIPNSYVELEPKYGHDEAIRRVKEAMDKQKDEYRRSRRDTEH